MKHIGYFLKAGVIVISIFVATNHLAYVVLKAFISDSGFRAVVAANAAPYSHANRPITLFIGNSRLMGGIDSTAFAAGDKAPAAYNLAYNGLYLEDLQMLLKAFMRSCSCHVKYVYAHPDIFREPPGEGQAASPLQVFLAAFDPDAAKAVREKDPTYGFALELFPLLHFNNEFFLRALYYKMAGKDDQRHSNNYAFSVTREIEQRLADMPPTPGLDVDAIDRLRVELADTGALLVIIEPPYHRAYIENVPGFQENHANMAKIFAAQGIVFLDHSGLFFDRPEFFSDPVHLNREGQQRYSEYLKSIADPNRDG